MKVIAGPVLSEVPISNVWIYPSLDPPAYAMAMVFLSSLVIEGHSILDISNSFCHFFVKVAPFEETLYISRYPSPSLPS